MKKKTVKTIAIVVVLLLILKNLEKIKAKFMNTGGAV